METRGPDVQGLTLLANGYARLGRHAEAWRAYHRLIQEMGSEAGADLYALQAEAMVMAADGYVSPEARQVLGEALQRNPAQPLARYFTGLALAQQGDRDGAVALWQGLRDEAEDGSPWAGALDNMIAEVTGATAPAPAPGPSAEDMAAAADMTPEEREQMIEGMVQRLETRLAAEGGAPEEWLRLMTAYRQLGRMDDARRAYAMGSDALEGGEASFLRQQALVMGIIEE
jgi:cytochrome c-type biogenesis protein CcmH